MRTNVVILMLFMTLKERRWSRVEQDGLEMGCPVRIINQPERVRVLREELWRDEL